MKTLSIYAVDEKGISDNQLTSAVEESIADYHGKLHKVLLIPPDFTRFHSGGGRIANIYYHLLKNFCQVDILPAVGTHNAVTREQAKVMFGDIPYEKLRYHDCRL